ncbi:hypothetical protein [Janthinobacterium sp. GW458P]|uniref:hypothetical protein n=1 Tax=Janthinobacterium sp. GW458P TaxID=1981504 RepID=UPI00111EC31B|nr:hypothetical protein [Janthinobacterium sp. GW458P]MBE3027931.1 hypothetical protein [Janthinobacterium sp. GW458P]
MTSPLPSFIRRYWILLVLRATCLSGSGTVSSDFFHRLVYYVNALLPTVGLPAETARVMKASYGPFFPEYQWELDRLVGANLVEVADLAWISTDQRFFGKYRITQAGRTLAEKLSQGTTGLADIERAISEMVSAFLSTPGALSTLAAKLDANFGQDTVRDGEIIDFGEWTKENHSRDAAEFLFQTWLSKIIPISGAPASSTAIPSSPTQESSPTGRSPYRVNWSADAQHSRSFHLYAHYLVHRLVQQAKSTVGV